MADLDSRASLLRSLKHILEGLKEILGQYWLPPHVLKPQILSVVASVPEMENFDVIISGETSNVSLYLVSSKIIIIITPFADVRENVALAEAADRDHSLFSDDFHVAIAFSSQYWQMRLAFPKVLLVNLALVENFPVPRLSLGVAVLASYIRRKQVGEVRIFDMQMGGTVQDVIASIRDFTPAIVGISITFGQKFLAFNLLDAIFEEFSPSGLPLLVAGNVIPALSPDEFLKRFPELLISAGEGENTIIGLLQHVLNGSPLSCVEGLIYLDENKKQQRTSLRHLPISEQTFPALDTLQDLCRLHGALTLELSRGCQYNVCTFCPREHKAGSWKGLSSEDSLHQLELMASMMDKYKLSRHLFLADEEFVGYLSEGEATDRLVTMAEGIVSRNLRIRFDTYARLDQIYSTKEDRVWHISRLKMWHKLKEAGLDRLFMGIESGSLAQLKRYGKGTTPEQAAVAVRLLTALGIGLHSGFIMFDPLMQGINDLKENIKFLERTDIVLNPIDFSAMSYDDLYDAVISDDKFIREHSAGQPLYTVVSYMLASLEVLINSPYARMMENTERLHGITLLPKKLHADTNMGRHYVNYLDEEVGLLADRSQRWIDRNFALAYALKSFYKTTANQERQIWLTFMIQYRELSHYLLKTMLFALGYRSNDQASQELSQFIGGAFLRVVKLYEGRADMPMSSVLDECLFIFEEKMLSLIIELQDKLQKGLVNDNIEGSMASVVERWYKNMGNWSLINAPC